MVTKSIAACSVCSYPLTATHLGQREICPMCHTINEAISGVDIPNPIFWGGLGILLGFILAKSKWVGGVLGKV